MAHHRQKYNSGPLALRNGHAKRPILKTRFSFANVTKSALRSAWPPIVSINNVLTNDAYNARVTT